jgi:hypothetical protein
MKILAFVSLFYCCIFAANAQKVVYKPQDKQLWQKSASTLESEKHLPLSKLIVRAGQQWLGTPYVAHTLERTDGEKLVVNLHEQDCTTFLENTLATAVSMKLQNPSFETYTDLLQQIRYRNGQIDGYPSRLHYFSEWLYENEKKGFLQVITKQLGGKPYIKPLNFMSSHRTAYAALKEDDNNYQQISKIEEVLNTRQYEFIPKAEVKSIENQLQDGDIIAITTGIQGLDVVHVGFAKMHNNRIHLLHASLNEKKVVISSKPLAEYLLDNKSQSGIMVARVVEK